ncbi:MAG: hypothetical protein U0232_15150 [Thermomicrobiales bacterium]
MQDDAGGVDDRAEFRSKHEAQASEDAVAHAGGGIWIATGEDGVARGGDFARDDAGEVGLRGGRRRGLSRRGHREGG